MHNTLGQINEGPKIDSNDFPFLAVSTLFEGLEWQRRLSHLDLKVTKISV